jgi:mono/diheme cytochrome c family protein
MKRALWGATSLALLSVAQIALSERKVQKANPSASFVEVPVVAKSWQNPYAGQVAATMAGKKLYQRHCAACHSQEGRRGDKAPGLRSPVVQEAAPGTLFWYLKNGNLRAGMPSWSRLPDQQLWQIVTYLQTLR